MSDSASATQPTICVRADGCVQFGTTIIEPWPSLRMTPPGNVVLSQAVFSAKPGDQLWAFVSHIPPRLLQRAREAPAYRWTLLELAAASPERGEELIFACPALALLVARSCPDDCEDHAGYFRDFLSRSWRSMLDALLLPAEARWIRVLRKMPLAHCTEWTLETLAEALRKRHPHLRVLCHLPQVTCDTVALMDLQPSLVTPRLLLASAWSNADAEPVRWCVETVSWFREEEMPGRPWPYRGLDAAALARVEARFRELYGDQGEGLETFPPPPFPGIPGEIMPLCDRWALIKEGEEQRNCIAGYGQDVVDGFCYVYSVRVAERATLLLRRLEEQTPWLVWDLRAEGNQPASEGTETVVADWLEANQPGSRQNLKNYEDLDCY